MGGEAPDCDEVLEGLAHFQALDVKVAQVQEVIHPLAPSAYAAPLVVESLSL